MTAFRLNVATCPVCRGNRLHYLFSVSGYRIVRCANCDLLMSSPQPTEEDLKRIYGEEYFVLGERDEGRIHVDELKQSTADLYLNLLERYRGEGPGRLLEIGCGHGDFLLRAAARGFTVAGVEYSSHACSVARDKLGDFPDAKIFCGEITSVMTEPRYDICVFCDVIEHIRDPRLFLECVSH